MYSDDTETVLTHTSISTKFPSYSLVHQMVIQHLLRARLCMVRMGGVEETRSLLSRA